ncbi:MAG TPA: hypothetical protein ENF22_02990 [Chloroflexi bacterium]|nr:hypothetical protein [Chloroflexota bacterium]
MAKMPNQMAQLTVAKYRCSRCWSSLVKEYAVNSDGEIETAPNGEALAVVKCRSCDADHGFVTQHFIERERVRDFGDYFEVKRDLIKSGVIQKEMQACQLKT